MANVQQVAKTKTHAGWSESFQDINIEASNLLWDVSKLK